VIAMFFFFSLTGLALLTVTPELDAEFYGKTNNSGKD